MFKWPTSFCSTLLLLLALNYCFQPSANAQEEPNEFSAACPFDAQSLQFKGTPNEQARCLLRKVEIQGRVGKPLKKLPDPLENLVGKSVKINKNNLRFYLTAHNLDESALGGALELPLSKAKLVDEQEIQAIYFIIHDTSDPYLKDALFPNEINDSNWSGNNLEKWRTLPVAHVFVNRAGESITIINFNETVVQGWGTKFARDRLKAAAKGLQLHIELVQPRRRDARRLPLATNDAIAPQPGFSEKQYERLALLYLCASVRRGSWLIPAFHAAIDAGIKDAHDDPQNFDLKMWATSLAKLIHEIK